MLFAGRGYRVFLRRCVIRALKKLIPSGFVYNTPRHYRDFFTWLPENKDQGILITIKSPESRDEPPPIIINHYVTVRFSRYFERLIPPAYVVSLKNGFVFGSQTNVIISSGGYLSSDLSREFGVYGGKSGRDFSFLCERLKLPSVRFISGRVGVVTTQGCLNFHHWLYDSLPRIFLLREAGLFQKTDFFLISGNGQSFQKESIKLMGVREEKIINQLGVESGIQASELYVPSLPSPLGSVSPWVIDFLRTLFNPHNESFPGFDRIFISRKNVKSRHLTNEKQFIRCLSAFGFKEVFPEDYSVADFAKVVAGSECVVSIHGSGLSNLCFIHPGTLVIDILAPLHQDAYYWQITNIRGGTYIGFFSEGEHPDDQKDLVKSKIDADLTIDMTAFEKLLITHLS